MGTLVAETSSIKIDHIQLKKEVVVFNHEKHIKNSINCVDCHHVSSANTQRSCVDCHGKDEKVPPIAKKTENGTYDFKSVIYHEKCIACHKEVSSKTDKKINSCKSCHISD